MTDYERGRADAFRSFRKSWEPHFYAQLAAQYGLALAFGFGLGFWWVLMAPVFLTPLLLTIPADLRAQERFWRGDN